MSALKRLGRPRPAVVETHAGIPVKVGVAPVHSVLEDWLVEDRWWSERPVRRRYQELVLENGRCILVFRDLASGRWFTQRG